MEEAKQSGQLREQKSKEDMSSLPSCFVCGDKSSGLHFGVVTCEACKVFFRRNHARDMGYACINGGSCDINVESRSCCSFCRLQKCFKKGMSKSNAVIGRRSNELKENIMASRRKQRTDKIKKPNTLYNEIIKETTQRLLKAHDDFRIITPEAIERVEQRKVQEEMSQQEIIGDPLPLEEIKKIYREAGIDLSGVVQDLISCARECTKKFALTFIHYVRSLKEFMDLSLHDRIITLKGSAYIWSLVSMSLVWNAKDQTMRCGSCGFCFSEKSSAFLPMQYIMFKKYFQTAEKLYKQDLTDNEIGVFRAFVIFDASLIVDQELEEPDKISAAQNLFLDCFLYTLGQTREEENVNRTFAKLVEFLTDLRFFINEKKKFITSECPEVKFERVAAEVLDCPEVLIDDFDQE